MRFVASISQRVADTNHVWHVNRSMSEGMVDHWTQEHAGSLLAVDPACKPLVEARNVPRDHYSQYRWWHVRPFRGWGRSRDRDGFERGYLIHVGLHARAACGALVGVRSMLYSTLR